MIISQESEVNGNLFLKQHLSEITMTAYDFISYFRKGGKGGLKLPDMCLVISSRW